MRERVYTEEPVPGEGEEYVEVREKRYVRRGCLGCGCYLPLAVLIVLVLTSAAIGGGCAIRAGDYRSVFGATLGNKDLARGTMPWYTQNQIGRNDSLLNQSSNFNLGVLEADETWAIGKYLTAPDADLDFNINTK